ncbi:MAG: protein translocase subunit SecD [Phycisphaerae bacterium]|nr:protein translocase subunit SecD [Phycisphaerae bacterium]NUQ44943.1 protein translocase subunit SecD [Phycisphaerae bacterium]
MSDRELWWKICIVAGLITLGFVCVYPLDQTIKLGIDLRGGYSLLYEIDDTGMELAERRDLSQRVMNILKERVDPNGVLNLVWRPVGTNRLEIQMPRPPQKVAEARDAYVAAQEKLIATIIRRGDVSVALTRSGEARDSALASLVRNVPSRPALFDKLKSAYDALQVAQQGDDDAALEASERAYDDAFASVMATNLPVSRFETALESDPRKPFRKEELEKLRNEHADVADLMNQAIAAYDEWNKLRGAGGTLDDPADLQRLLRGAGVLEFRLLAEQDPADPTRYDSYIQNLSKRGPRRGPGDEYAWFPIENPAYFYRHLLDGKAFESEFENIKRQYGIAERYGDKYYILATTAENKTLTQEREAGRSWQLQNAMPTRDEQGRPAVSFVLDEAGGNRFFDLTSKNRGKQLCIFLDGQAVSSANINSAIRTRGIIQGNFSTQEVSFLCQKLNAGSLPRKLKEPPISVRGIGPSLGMANRQAGQTAAVYGIIAVAVFMFCYYWYSGSVAVFAMLLNLLLTGAVVATLNATMTLPAIAGLVLGIGMAVDANVLINERIREELARGQTTRMAIKFGYERAFSAIFDSNLTTILTCGILYMLGSEEIKGFGLTLGWSVVINLLTAVYVTRIFFDYMSTPRLPSEVVKYPWMLGAALAMVGGAAWGLGKWLIDPAAQATSVSMFFGRMLMTFLPALALVFVILVVMRIIHQSVQKGGVNRIPMLHLVPLLKVDWFSLRRVFYAISLVTTIGGLAIFYARDNKDLYDIEFLGGVAAQIDLKQPGSLTERDVEARLKLAGDEMRSMADKLEAAQVAEAPPEFVMTAPGIPSERLANMVRAQMTDFIPPGGIRFLADENDRVYVRFHENAKFPGDVAPSLESIKTQLRAAAQRVRNAATQIADAQVQAILGIGGATASGIGSFEIVTRETSRELVVDAILSKLQDDLDIQQSLEFTLRKDMTRGEATYFPVTSDDLGAVIGDESVTERVPTQLGGVAIVAEDISPPQTIAALEKRLRDMRLQPGQAEFGWRQQDIYGLTAAGSEGDATTYSRVAVLVSDENYAFEEGGDNNAWRSDLAEPEVQLVRTAMERQTSLGKVTQFAPQVAADAKTSAFLALLISWAIIVAYLGFRFGNVTWGVAALVALVHDAIVALGFVAGSYLLAGYLMIEAFRIDLAIVAALLTVIGYSVNDTIVVFDRIRENRGKLKDVTPQLMNDSINQTLSRTMLTALSTMLTILIMYIWGGRGIHGFNYAMLVGIITGTYSSIFVASPIMVWLNRRFAKPA